MTSPLRQPSQPVPVLHIITRLIVGGAQENTLYTALLLDGDRYAVEVLSGVQTGSEGSLIEEGLSRGVKISLLPPLVRQLNPLLDLIALWKLVLILRRKRYVIVHTHSSKAGILGRLAAWLVRTPVILHTVHGWSFHAYQPFLTRTLYILLERLCARFTHALIAVTERDIHKGLQAGIGEPNQYRLIRSAIPLEEFDPARADPGQARRGLGLPPEAPVLGTVGRFSPQKNPLEWLQVAELVSRALPDCHFLMVGDGPLRPQVESHIAARGLGEKVRLVGIQRDIPRMLSAMDVFLLTSRWEGLPRVIPQAMSMGVPVVATGVDGSAEVIQDGVNGFVCPPGDVNCLADRCLKLLSDPHLRQTFRQAGYATAREQFDLGQMVAQIDALYRELLVQTSTG